MFRLRRYRVVLVCAFVITVLLYHVSKNSQWDHSREMWHPSHGRPRPRPPPPASKPKYDGGRDHDHQDDRQPQKPQQKPPPPPHPVHLDTDDGPQPNQEPNIRIPQLKTADGVKGGYGLPTRAPAPPQPTKVVRVPDRTPPSNHDDYGKQHEDAVPTSTAIHWQKFEEFFPVPEESLIMLPTGKPKHIPSVQYAFAEESPAAKEKRELRLAKIKAEAQHAWSGYKKYAWTHDELAPVTKKGKDPFCGWAATLVDSLDTLWIMGLKEEFDDAIEAVRDIDFSTTPYRDDIPVFETIIRYLGGLVGAYDVTNNDPKYRVLLDKAVELAEILMSVFDTPNRLPILYYNWKPSHNINPKRASTSAGVAELGTMSMEFTRLAQLTGKQKYYDAIARITDAFEELQNREGATAIPGIFPQNLDASGCNRTAPLPSTLENSSTAAQKHVGEDNLRRSSEEEYEAQNEEPAVAVDTGFHRGPQKRDGPPGSAPDSFNARGLPANWECAPQGLTGGGYGAGSYSMGGSQDSTYEYFPKQYLMLGGLEPKYRTMHEKTVDAVKQYLLFRPMAEGDPDILFSAKAYSTDGTAEKMSYEWEVTHLTCFLGGMFGLGGKIFDRPEDVEIGKKLADGCVWAYDVMPQGIMPEYATLLPCKKPDDCRYDKNEWYAALDPSAGQRDKQMADYYQKLADWKVRVEELQKENALRKQQAEERKREAEASLEEVPSHLSEGGSSSELTQKDTLPASGLQKRDTAFEQPQNSLDLNSPSSETRRDSITTSDQKPMDDIVLPPAPDKPYTHLEYVTQRIQREHIPSGFVTLNDKRYILRPEAIESVWYMYRITGDPIWQEKGWRMYEAVIRATRTEAGHSAIRDVTSTESRLPASDMEDSMESFWLAETLKYFYLLFTTPDVISLDEWVLNTEAHPFKRPT